MSEVPSINKKPKTKAVVATTTIVNETLSIKVLSDIRLIPGDNLVTANQLKVLNKNKDFLFLKKEFKMNELSEKFREDIETDKQKTVLELEQTAADAEGLEGSTTDEPKDIEDMTVAELKEVAESLGVTGVSNANKDTIINAIKLVKVD